MQNHAARSWPVRTVMLFLCMLCLAINAGAYASDSLPSRISAYGGSYETTDGYGATCVNGNAYSAGCSCPGGVQPQAQFRVLNDVSGPGSVHGGNLMMCSAGTNTASEYAGGYQLDDAVAGGAGCRFANGITGSCSCPAGTNSVQMRVAVDGTSGIFLNSSLYMCMKATSVPQNFGGAYQYDDDNSCRAANPYTGGCSCPANFSGQPHRAEIMVNGNRGGTTLMTCLPAAQTAQICPGNSADPTGRISATSAIQNCINSTTAGAELAIPAGTYLIDGQLLINKAMTLRTLGTAPSGGTAVEPCGRSTPCATLLASPNQLVHTGFLYVANTPHVTVDHIILDGNRFKRLGSVAYSRCTSTTAYDSSYGYNAEFLNSPYGKFTNSITTRALCGSALSFDSDFGEIANSVFSDNGDGSVPGAWSDGLTVGIDNGSIHDNQFINNSDVNMVLVRGVNTPVKNNTIVMNNNHAFAGIQLDNFANNWSGDFSGGSITNNTVNCAPGKCFFAVNIGAHPWNPSSSNVFGATFTNNTLTGGVITLNVDGGGTPAHPITISNNNLGSAHTGPAVSCGPSHGTQTIVSSRYNVSPDSTVTGNQGSPDTVQVVHQCEGG